jgi:hypothetical protein
VEEFWSDWNHLPHRDPKNLFTLYHENSCQLTEGFNKQTEALALFEEGIKPTWEDPLNEKGADFSVKKFFNLDVLGSVWEKLVYALIGEQLRHSKSITGCRIVDKRHQQYKVEVWYRFTPDACPELSQELQASL